MTNHTLYDLLNDLESENIVFVYRGEINSDLLESVYSIMSGVLDKSKALEEKRKKFFYILIEALQNVFHHQVGFSSEPGEIKRDSTGFVIRRIGNDSYKIITGNYILNNNIESLEKRIVEVNSHTPDSLRDKYKQSLAQGELSNKGGAGLGIIEMARKSGHKLKFEFTKINDEYAFFSLEVTIE